MKHDFMSHDLHLPELTFRGMLLGILITVIFTASNVYLGLKVGLTFSSSIPAAVISMAILRFFKDSNVLENNMVQTQASAAGTLSAVIFVLPGLLMLGYWQGFPFAQTLLLCACGGCLGVLFTIPLRRAMVVNSDLPYPEGRAAAEILKVGSQSHDPSATTKSSSGMSLVLRIFFLPANSWQSRLCCLKRSRMMLFRRRLTNCLLLKRLMRLLHIKQNRLRKIYHLRILKSLISESELYWNVSAFQK